jgi:hypothetical protein
MVEECSALHLHCPRFESTILPSRILDVSPENGLSTIKLIEGRGSSGKYIALSYCWGGEQKKTLTTESREAFCDAISLDILPQTILDAVHVTRSLGIKYLWVDALCILQDSQVDKQHEVAKINSIYKNAYATISAASAPSANAGFWTEDLLFIRNLCDFQSV